MTPKPIAASFRPSRRRVLRAAAAIACAGPALLHAQSMSDRDIRVAYLFNFVRFAQWPDIAFSSAESPIAVCALDGRDAVAGVLAPLDGKMVGPRPIRVVPAITLADARQCHVVYVAESAHGRLPALRESLGNAPTLLVGETDGALDRGAMIAFRAQELRLGFVVNLAATRRAGLKLPPQVLKLALEVRE